jgi:hypothetical protein
MRVPVLLSCGVLVGLSIGLLACSPPAPPPEKPATTWGGDFTPVVSVKELMRDVIDPLSDNIFLSVGTRVSMKGVEEWHPKTDDDWAKVRTGAVAIAEVSHLLKVPRPFAPKGDVNNSTGPDAPELSPTQILEKLQKDPVLWQAKIEVLRNVGREVLDIVERRDAGALEEAAENLDAACEGCHLEYWYPNQKELMKRLRREQ